VINAIAIATPANPARFLKIALKVAPPGWS
jgi:hypothetical protein